jgi:hypothetical protein
MYTSTNIHNVTKLKISSSVLTGTSFTVAAVTDAEGQIFTLNLYHDTGKLEIVHTGYEPIGASDQESAPTATNGRDKAFAKWSEAEKKERLAWLDYQNAETHYHNT